MTVAETVPSAGLSATSLSSSCTVTQMRPSGPTASVRGSLPTRTSQRPTSVCASIAATVPLSGLRL